jgi:hypothetical protein
MFDFSILAIPGAALARNIAGWFETAKADGKIDDYEWKQLGITVARFVIIGGGLMLGLKLDAFEAAGSAILVDFVLSTAKKIGKK